MGKQNAKQNMRCRGKLLPVLLLLCVALTLTLGFALAKYAQTTDLDTPQEADAAKFYFTSDLLTEETAQRSGEETIHHISYFDFNAATFPIKLYNFKDELNVSQVDITYDLECWVGQNVTITKDLTLKVDQNGAPVTQTITLTEGTHFPNITGDTQIIVRAVAKEPYDQVLTATFQMHWFDDSITLSVNDSAGSNAALVTLETGILGGAGTASRFVTITYPEGLIPDAIDTRMVENNFANRTVKIISSAEVKEKVDAEGNVVTDNDGTTQYELVSYRGLYGDNKYTFIFYKTDPSKVYTAIPSGEAENDFVVTVYDDNSFETLSKTSVKYE